MDTVNTVYAQSRDGLTGFSIVKVGRMMRYMWQVVRAAMKGKIDLVILSPAFHRGPFLKDSLFILLAQRVCGARVMAWVHMSPDRMHFEACSGWYRIYVRWVMTHVDCMVSCAPSLSGRWPDFLQSLPVKVVANGVDDEAEQWVREPSAGERFRIGFLSAMHKEKGWVELYEVALKICEENEHAEFHFYGGCSKESEQELMQQFSNNPHGSRIQWHGQAWGKAKVDAYQQMDLFCLPSHTEAFPLAVLEAMSFYLPVVATDVGAVRDALTPGLGGWMCNPASVGHLYDTVSEAIRRKQEWPAMGKWNRKIYLEFFSVKAFSRSWKALIDEMAGLSA